MQDMEQKQYGYATFINPFPLCNHTKKITKGNIGYVQGMMDNGIAFEAELWKSASETNVSFVLPYTKLVIEERTAIKPKCSKRKTSKIVGFRMEEEVKDHGILTIGMVENGVEENIEVIEFYLEFVLGAGLVWFTGELRNGSVRYMIDELGHEVVVLNVMLKKGREIFAKTELEFNKFQYFSL